MNTLKARRLRTGVERTNHQGYSAASFNGKVYVLSQLEIAVRRAEKIRDFCAQHGPVKIIMQNGKPVEPK